MHPDKCQFAIRVDSTNGIFVLLILKGIKPALKDESSGLSMIRTEQQIWHLSNTQTAINGIFWLPWDLKLMMSLFQELILILKREMPFPYPTCLLERLSIMSS